MNFKIILLFLFLMGFFSHFVSSAHYITGYVNDALDGTDSENYTILMWNPAIGLSDNLIDSIGFFGSSGRESMYLLDCELLNNGCSVGDVLYLEVIDNGDGYISHTQNVTVTGAGYDFVENITLNSPPEVFLNFPLQNEISNNFPEFFNCSFSDLDSLEGNLSLWGNWSGWSEKQRYEVSSGDSTHIFSEFLSEGIYNWTCVSEDDLGVQTFGENRTLRIDFTNPSAEDLYFNESYACGDTLVEITCETFDFYGLEEVLIEAASPTFSYNLSTTFVGSNNYSTTFFMNETGEWLFTCHSKDNAGNYNSSYSEFFQEYSGYPEIYVNSSKITFDKENYIEGDFVNISSAIENRGCVDSGNFIISFFEDSSSFENQIGENITTSLNKFSTFVANMSYFAPIGKTNIFVFADSGLEILENNESDNIGNNSYYVPLWQDFYGNVTAIKVLKNEKNFTGWSLEENVVGNVFVADSESEIDWLSLVPIGKDIFNNDKLDDFSEIDELFGTTSLEDSITNEYLEDGQIKYKTSFIVHQKLIESVAVINSTESSPFLTGILWDSSDSVSNDEFDSIEKEDLVFVTAINISLLGKYGVYDYEIKVPAKLRDYHTEDTSEVYFYYDLV
jgi:hypothetical protein